MNFHQVLSLYALLCLFLPVSPHENGAHKRLHGRTGTSPADESPVGDIKNITEYYRSFLLPRILEEREHSCALVTIVHNEAQLIPIWVGYYVKHIDPRDIYIIDDHSTDNSLTGLQQRGINVLSMSTGIPRPSQTHRYDVEYVEGFGSQLFAYTALLAGYKCYISTDIDEVLITDPDIYPLGLRGFISRFMEDDHLYYVKATGKELLHISNGTKRNIEPSLNWSLPLLSQRSYWAGNPVYDKISISKVPLRYTKGKHLALRIPDSEVISQHPHDHFNYPKHPTMLASYDVTKPWLKDVPRKDLILVHMHSMDITYCKQREAHKFFNLQYHFEGLRMDTQEWTKLVESKKLCGKAMGKVKRSKDFRRGNNATRTWTGNYSNNTSGSMAYLSIAGGELIDLRWKKSGL